VAQWTREFLVNQEIAGSNPGRRIFFFLVLLLFLSLSLYFQMCCYTIMNISITLPENVNKSRVSAGSLSLRHPRNHSTVSGNKTIGHGDGAHAVLVQVKCMRQECITVRLRLIGQWY
jgi:hypothetical protein